MHLRELRRCFFSVFPRLPRNFARPHVAAGALVEIPFENLSNGLDLWVDVVWSRERPLGLGAQRFVALIARKKN